VAILEHPHRTTQNSFFQRQWATVLGSVQGKLPSLVSVGDPGQILRAAADGRLDGKGDLTVNNRAAPHLENGWPRPLKSDIGSVDCLETEPSMLPSAFVEDRLATRWPSISVPRSPKARRSQSHCQPLKTSNLLASGTRRRNSSEFATLLNKPTAPTIYPNCVSPVSQALRNCIAGIMGDFASHSHHEHRYKHTHYLAGTTRGTWLSRPAT